MVLVLLGRGLASVVLFLMMVVVLIVLMVLLMVVEMVGGDLTSRLCLPLISSISQVVFFLLQRNRVSTLNEH